MLTFHIYVRKNSHEMKRNDINFILVFVGAIFAPASAVRCESYLRRRLGGWVYASECRPRVVQEGKKGNNSKE